MPRSSLTVSEISRPAKALLDGPSRRGVLLNGSATSTYVNVDGFVLMISSGARALLPNAIRVEGDEPPPPLGAGIGVTLGPTAIRFPQVDVRLPPSVVPWDPFVGTRRWATPSDVHGRGTEILRALGLGSVNGGDEAAHAVRAVAPGGWGGAAAELSPLFDGLAAGRVDGAVASAAAMLGTGPGLTPQADDVLWAVLLTLAAVARTVGIQGNELRHWREALCPPDVHQRTNSMSTTLLRLAALGDGPEPVVRLLDPTAAWGDALERLYAMGHSSGRVSAVTMGVAMCLLGRRQDL